MKKPLFRYIEKYMPTFCFQTPFEILTMLEQVDESVDYFSLSATITRLHQQGYLMRRKASSSRAALGGGRGPIPFEYARAVS